MPGFRIGKFDKLYKTRFPELFYTKLAAAHWQFVVKDEPTDEGAQTGRFYASKAELEANIETFAAEYGFEDAIKPVVPPSDATTAAQKLNGLNVHRVKAKNRDGKPNPSNDTIFIPLPPELWRKTSGCGCDVCKADKTGGWWDTLAVGVNPPVSGRVWDDRTWTVHYPELHNEVVRKSKAYTVQA